jgi:hypothetical protein
VVGTCDEGGGVMELEGDLGEGDLSEGDLSSGVSKRVSSVVGSSEDSMLPGDRRCSG